MRKDYQAERTTTSNSLNIGKNGSAAIPGRHGVLRNGSNPVNSSDSADRTYFRLKNEFIALANNKRVDLANINLFNLNEEIIRNLIDLVTAFDATCCSQAVGIYIASRYSSNTLEALKKLKDKNEKKITLSLDLINNSNLSINYNNLFKVLNIDIEDSRFEKIFALCKQNSFEDEIITFVERVLSFSVEKQDFACGEYLSLKKNSKLNDAFYNFLLNIDSNRINSSYNFASAQNFSAATLHYIMIIQNINLNIEKEALAISYYKDVINRSSHTIDEVLRLINEYSNEKAKRLIDLYKKYDFDIKKVTTILDSLQDKATQKAESEKNLALENVNKSKEGKLHKITPEKNTKAQRNIFGDKIKAQLTRNQKKQFEFWLIGDDNVISKDNIERYNTLLEKLLNEENKAVLDIIENDKKTIEASYSAESEVEKYMNFFYRVDGYENTLAVLDGVNDNFDQAEKIIRILQLCNDKFLDKLLNKLNINSLVLIINNIPTNAIKILENFEATEINKAFSLSNQFPLLAIADVILTHGVAYKENLLKLSLVEVNRLLHLTMAQINTVMNNTSYDALKSYSNTDNTLNLLLALKAVPVNNAMIEAWSSKLNVITKFLPNHTPALVNLIQNRNLDDLEACASFLPDGNFANLTILLTKINNGYSGIFNLCNEAKPAVSAANLLTILNSLPINQPSDVIRGAIFNHILTRTTKEPNFLAFLLNIDYLVGKGYCTLTDNNNTWTDLNNAHEVFEKKITIRVNGNNVDSFVAHYHPNASEEGVGSINASKRHFKSQRGNLQTPRVYKNQFHLIPSIKPMFNR